MLIRAARALSVLVVLASTPLLALTALAAYDLSASDAQATLMMTLRGWSLGPLFSLGLALLAEVYLIVPGADARKRLARIWWVALASHVLLAAPAIGAKLTKVELSEALTTSWLLDNPWVAIYAAMSVLAPDLIAVGLITGAGEVRRAEKNRPEPTPEVGVVEIPAKAAEPKETETFECPDCKKPWTKPVGKKEATLRGHAPHCPAKVGS